MGLWTLWVLLGISGWVFSGQVCSNPVGCDVANCVLVGGVSHCLSCLDGYFYRPDDHCEPCQKDCKSCNNIDSCLICNPGFKLNSEGRCYNPTAVQDPQTGQGGTEGVHGAKIESDSVPPSEMASTTKTVLVVVGAVVGFLMLSAVAYYCNKSAIKAKVEPTTSTTEICTARTEGPVSQNLPIEATQLSEVVLKKQGQVSPTSASRHTLVEQIPAPNPTEKKAKLSPYYRRPRNLLIGTLNELQEIALPVPLQKTQNI